MAIARSFHNAVANASHRSPIEDLEFLYFANINAPIDANFNSRCSKIKGVGLLTGNTILGRSSSALLSVAIIGILARETFAAPIRAYMPQIWYVFDALTIFALAAGILACASKFPRTVIISVIALAASSVYSLQQNTAISTAFSLRYILYFLSPIVLVAIDGPIKTRLWVAILFLGMSAAAGVFADYFIKFEWGAQTFVGVLGERVIARDWWLRDGTKRLSGLGISSTNTAHIIVCAGLLCLPVLALKKRTATVIVLGILLIAAYLTRQRASFAWFSLLVILSVLMPLHRPAMRISFASLKALIVIAISLMVTAPFTLANFDIGALFDSPGNSLSERALTVWPNAIETISSGWGLLFGRGVGSVGELSAYPALQAPDNMFLNLGAMFGLFNAAMLCSGLLLVSVRASLLDSAQLGSIAVATFIVFNGVTANMVLSAVPMTFLGLAAAGLAHRVVIAPNLIAPHQARFQVRL